MSDDKKSELKIKAIENGTVIDHITANKSLHILKILELPNDETKNVTIAMNVSSSEIGRKDILKIENRELDSSELNQIALIAPKATINIIRDFNEPITPKFKVITKNPPQVRCHYCEKLIKTEDIEKQFE